MGVKYIEGEASAVNFLSSDGEGWIHHPWIHVLAGCKRGWTDQVDEEM